MEKFKVLVNFVHMGRKGVHIPWLVKFKYLESLGCDLELLSSKFIMKMQLADKDVYNFNQKTSEFMVFPKVKWTKFLYIWNSLKTNILGLFYVKKILKNNYDVIYSPSSVLDLIVIPYVVKLFDKKIIWVNVFDNIVPFTDPGNKIFRILAWLFFQISLFLIKKSDCIFVISEDLKAYLIGRGFDKNKIILTGNAVEVELIKKAKRDERYDFDAVFMGRINETKGIYDMLKVLDIIRKQYPEFKLAIIGEGDEKTMIEFEAKIKKMALGNNIQFLGFIEGLEKYNILKSGKCFWFLSISKSESFGISLLEAVCCGLPAFAYDLPQFSYIYQNNEVNISTKHDYASVAEKVLDLFKTKNFNNDRGKLLLDEYSWEKIAELEYNSIQNIKNEKKHIHNSL